MEDVPYRSAVGSLLYLANCTRPDIAEATMMVSRFSSRPGRQHWAAVKKIFKYLRGTSKVGITFRGSNGDLEQLHGYCDSNWGGDLDTRRSTTGYVFFMNGPICWRSKLQPTVALSSVEAEYMAISLATQEAVWLRLVLEELGFAQGEATRLLVDNQGAIALARNSVHHQRTKHIDIRHHYVREQTEEGTVELSWISTKKNVADLLTKATSSQTLVQLRPFLMGDASN
jgi:hypothetical protein